MSPRLSRRSWVFLMGSAPLLAQTVPQPQTPPPGEPKARSEVKQVSDKLAAIEIPMTVEPAFRFVAF